MFKHLLVPLDGSKLAELALPMAKEIAVQFGSKITLLQVVPLPYAIGYGHEASGMFSSINQDMKREAVTYMETKQQALHQAGISVEVQIVTGQSPAEAILNATDELAVDTVVMSTHGRGGVMRWVFGSVADRVLRQARVPILLARVPPEKGSAPTSPVSKPQKVQNDGL